MLHELKRLSVLLSFVVCFTSVFSSVAFAEELLLPEEVITEEVEEVDEIEQEDEAAPPLLIPIENGIEAETEDADFSIMSEEDKALLASAGTKVTKYYNQPELYVADGYDAIQFFVTNNGAYTGKAYFVVSENSSSQNWLLYNYKEETAKAYFTKTDLFNGLYVPSNKAAARQDNTVTVSIDETKVPTITQEAYNGMYCNWRNFSDIPFSKAADGSLIYATYEVEEAVNPGDDPSGNNPGGENTNPSGNNPGGENTNPSGNNPGGGNTNPSGNNPGGGNTNPGGDDSSGNTDPGTTPSQDNSWSQVYYRYTVSLNSGNTYRVFITKSVSYNGKKHVLSTAKSGKKKVNDIKLYVYLNNQLVDPKLYSVTFKNNQNVNKYKGESVPYAIIKFKFKNEALKADKEAFKKKAFGFNINPMNLKNGKVALTYKKSGAVKKAIFTASDNSVLKMTAKDYSLSADGNGKTVVTGKGNYCGTQVLDSAAPSNGGIY